ncbi:MAG: hypothetical protein ABIM50_14230 [Novosphingobium sp.]
MTSDTMRTISKANPLGGNCLQLEWSDGTVAQVVLPDVPELAGVEVGDWGHSLVWPDGTEIGADSLWLDTLSAIGRGDSRLFLKWRLANGLSLAKAAEALGLARRTVAYYSNGDRPVPKTVLLACKGWAATHRRKAA